MSNLDAAITEIHSKSLAETIKYSEENKISYPFNKGLKVFFEDIKKKSVEFKFNMIDVFSFDFDNKGRVSENSEETVKPSNLEGVLSNINGAISFLKEKFLINRANEDIKRRREVQQKNKSSNKSNMKPN